MPTLSNKTYTYFTCSFQPLSVVSASTFGFTPIIWEPFEKAVDPMTDRYRYFRHESVGFTQDFSFIHVYGLENFMSSTKHVGAVSFSDRHWLCPRQLLGAWHFHLYLCEYITSPQLTQVSSQTLTLNDMFEKYKQRNKLKRSDFMTIVRVEL